MARYILSAAVALRVLCFSASPGAVGLTHAPQLTARTDPGADADGDGVADVEDPCPGSTAGEPATVPGCTTLELLQQPAAVFGPLTAKTSAIVTDLRAIEMHDVRASLEAATEDFSDAERLVRRGDVCASSRPFAHADEVISSALDAIDRQLADARAAVRGRAAVRTAAGTAGDPAGDVTEADLLVVWLEYFREQVDGVRGWSRTGAEAFAHVCGTATVDSVHGEIQSILDSQRRIVLTDGRTFGLAEPITVPGDISEGRAVQLTGLMFRDGNGYASGVEPHGGAPAAPKATFVQCAKLRFAPVQRFPPVSSGPFVLHDPLGYNVEGTYKVEAGMGIAVQSTCPPDLSGKSFLRYSMKVEISYQQKGTSAAVDHALMAAELTASDDPVLFSSDIDPQAPATLHVESDVRSCKQLKSLQCTDPTVIDTNDYPLFVRARGALAFALYDQVEFDVNDQLNGDFRFGHVSFFASIPGADDGTSPIFVAEGFGPFFGGISEAVIVNDDPFAIRSTDFYPIFEPYTLAQSLQQLVAGWQSGVNHAAGLRWPRVEGTRNGHDFWYSASLPLVTRDVVNFCDAPNAYYRLPFAQGDFNWTQGQGNHPELPPATPGFTHSGGYAYDMLAPLNTEIRAARAGRVVKINESNTLQCNPGDGCPPNNLFIRHQDGSIGEYVHMPKDSVLPEVGGSVLRGELLAVVGVVGQSTAPHLHFATRTQPKPGGVTFLAKFEALVFPLTDPETALTCYVPQQGDTLRSNNVPK